MFGVFPNTLRLWEKKDYIRPYRTPGGQRRYTAAEIERVKRGMGMEPDKP
jgi:DNA-binding transcriptional MerR regulator